MRPPHASPGCASRFRTEVAYAARNATTVTGISSLKWNRDPLGSREHPTYAIGRAVNIHVIAGAFCPAESGF